MAGRKDPIDWEAIERDYRLGQLSAQELGRRHGVPASTITRKAKRDKWIEDFSDEIKARTKAGLIELAKQQAQQHATESNSALRDGIEVAVAINVAIIRQHQTGIRSNRDRLERLTEKFDTLVGTAADLNEIAKAAGSFESMVRTQKTLVGLERQAFNISDEQKEVDESIADAIRKAGIARLIAQINGTTLPIVKEPDSDD